MNIQEFVERLLAKEVYCFSIEECVSILQKPKGTVKFDIARLVTKGELVTLRQGFYLILPPRYRAFGKLPISLYIDKLFSYLGKKYYVSFYSAAKIYGASHQQIQKDYIMTERPAPRNIDKNNIMLQFVSTGHWPPNNIVTRKYDAGLYNVSSASLTFFDIVRYQGKL